MNLRHVPVFAPPTSPLSCWHAPLDLSFKNMGYMFARQAPYYQPLNSVPREDPHVHIHTAVFTIARLWTQSKRFTTDR